MKTLFTLAMSAILLNSIAWAEVNEAKSTANTSVSGQRVVKSKTFYLEPRIGYASIDYTDTAGNNTSQTSNTAQLGTELFITNHISLMGSASTTFNHMEPSDSLTAQYIEAQASLNNTVDIWNRNFQLSYGGGVNYATIRDQSGPFGYDSIIGPMVRSSLTRVFSDLNSLTFDAQYGNIGAAEDRFSLRDYQLRAALDYRFRLFGNTQMTLGAYGTIIEILQNNSHSTSRAAALTAGLNI